MPTTDHPFPPGSICAVISGGGRIEGRVTIAKIHKGNGNAIDENGHQWSRGGYAPGAHYSLTHIERWADTHTARVKRSKVLGALRKRLSDPTRIPTEALSRALDALTDTPT